MSSYAQLGSIAEFINGAAFKPSDWGETGKQIIRIQNLTDPSKPCNRTTRTVSPKLTVYPGDLLVSWSASLGIFEWAGPEEALLNQHIFRVLPNQKKVEKRYLRHVLEGALKDMQQHLHGATMQHVNRGEFLATQVFLPPLAEQKRIAAILDKADAIRKKRKKAIDLTETLLRSTFLDMFGDPVTNPKGWDIVFGKEVFHDLQYGTSVKCSDFESEKAFPVLRIPNIIGGNISTSELKYVQLPEKEANKLALKRDDILFVRTNGNPDYIGRCAVVDETSQGYLFASYLIRAKVPEKSGMVVGFVKTQMLMPSYRGVLIREAKTTAGNYNISTEGLRALRFIAPPASLQKKYLQLCQRQFECYANLASHLRHSEVLFHALSQRAFRGEL